MIGSLYRFCKHAFPREYKTTENKFYHRNSCCTIDQFKRTVHAKENYILRVIDERYNKE